MLSKCEQSLQETESGPKCRKNGTGWYKCQENVWAKSEDRETESRTRRMGKYTCHKERRTGRSKQNCWREGSWRKTQADVSKHRNHSADQINAIHQIEIVSNVWKGTRVIQRCRKLAKQDCLPAGASKVYSQAFKPEGPPFRLLKSGTAEEESALTFKLLYIKP